MDVLMTTVYDKEHNSHAHLISLTTEATTHDHGSFDTYTELCGEYFSQAHHHLCTLTSSGSHTHTFSVWSSTESATDLNHTHSFSSSTSAQTYPHTHSASSCASEACTYGVCAAHPHTHPYSGITASAGNSHSHTISGTTNTGVGTLYWHTHYIGASSSYSDSHTHGSLPDLGMAVCWYSNYHAHYGGVLASVTHLHQLYGYSDYAGEPPPAPTVRTFPSPVL